ncbi:Predicted protein [Taphrina deformans PYCC 5710]|uniref:GH16 domain-containing protein n=1 Tax=Taphrina deformans (strain PYCC 5710 / ATCC 11124 / CBS 356.35 / IMI 108563 / JCM 9778 / NBRC 8474) TaxID=1097556 RepID=R4X8C3_TAPDE|nr:Predicted protein [Taphrina deformans PYCC 5710]|eukprot:CCG81819.1 Predicted protein [Taphrina deformans PYCC 5710]
MLLGFVALFLSAYWGYSEVPKHKFREIWYEDFTSGLDLVNDWNHEIALGGYGAGTFDWTTSNDNNSFVRDGKLYIYPTLTTWPPNIEGNSVNLTADGTCTLNTKLDCYASHNDSSFQVINPVQSARLTTKGKHTIRFGKVEIRVKMPRGRYLWPALWMMPQDSVYGIWPASGELDIFEGRGNDPTKLTIQASQCMQSSAHWGPDYSQDPERQVQLSKKQTKISCWPRRSLTQDYHTYTLEWTPQRLLFYIDSPLYVMQSITFRKGPFDGGIDSVLDSLGTPVPNPWSSSPLKAAPFDQHFYLILNVAVGSYNGWFPEDNSDNPAYSTAHGTGGQPYEAVHDFWKSQHQWYPTWPTDLTRGMAVDWIRMSELVDTAYWENLASARMNGRKGESK